MVAETTVYRMGGEGRRAQNAGDLAGHLQAASKAMPHVRHLLQ